MHPHDLVARHREHCEGVVLAQIVLGGKGKLPQVVERLQVIGVDSVGIEPATVVVDVVIRLVQGPAQAFDLERGDLVAAGGFNRFVGGGTTGCDHGVRLPDGQKGKPYYMCGHLSTGSAVRGPEFRERTCPERRPAAPRADKME